MKKLLLSKKFQLYMSIQFFKNIQIEVIKHICTKNKNSNKTYKYWNYDFNGKKKSLIYYPDIHILRKLLSTFSSFLTSEYYKAHKLNEKRFHEQWSSQAPHEQAHIGQCLLLVFLMPWSNQNSQQAWIKLINYFR